ncbi:MAG: hypothetical protein QY330_04040 [Candidatus Dojkabacteria bacterium]|uniref:DUF4145 domain-containing protein n=2 Tax=Candidatus Dojkabacteria TaxID=74243 RepID=A0A136KG76_9BACT|nr:MAG: hypothetical protein UZ20_WS6002000960 [candidate division WS6 bacterium OLB21]MBW7954104.1 hypothetical protein [Candidatus Dojkabacteria bacterium]WKZ27693.1 MAG: hypothetical protein QY330_04040 [Candidatus Dojkabacteria bacterium]
MRDYEVLVLVASLVCVFGLFIIGTFVSAGSRKQSWRYDLYKRLKKAKLKKVNSKPEAIAVLIEAHALFDRLLVGIGAEGSTLGERLSNMRRYFTKEDYQELREANRLRNIVVHEPETVVYAKQIKHAKSVFLNIAVKYLKHQ